MSNLSMRMTLISPLAVYPNARINASPLAPRPSSLDGKVVGLLPNWRPMAVDILKSLGTLLEQRFRLKAVVMEERITAYQQVVQSPTPEMLDDLARRVDVVIAGSGD